MAEATTQITVTPKQLGKHLRTIRRKKGLSLSEVARGAGLSRRELVSYERGKLPIPESDLWVLAGSCGVDVAELMPSASSMELTAAASATTVGDTVSQLRKGQEDAGITQYLHTLHKLQALPPGKRIPVKERELDDIATALGSTPRSIEEKLREVLNVDRDEAERLRAMILVPPGGRGKPRALAAAPSALAAAAALAPAPAPAEAPPVADVAPPPDVPAPVPESPAEPVAFVPEAAPEPLQTFPAAPAAFLDQPLDAPIDSVHGQNVDVFEELARLPEPVPLGDPGAPMPDLLAPPDPFATPLGVPAIGPPEGTVELVDSTMPDPAVVAAGGAAAWNAADAPPIDVAMRQGSSTWDLGEPPLVATPTPAPLPTSWETDGWQPPVPDGTERTPNGFWESTDDWTPPVDAADGNDGTEGTDGTAGPGTDVIEVPSGEPMAIGEDTWAGAAWDPEPWSPADTVDVSPPESAVVEVNPWATEQWASEPADRGAWEHQPDPAAVDSGFYVDWGTPDTEAPAALEMFAESTVAPAPADEEIASAWETWIPSTDFTTTETDFTAGETAENAEPVEEPVDTVEAEPADATFDPEPVADATWGPWGTWAPSSDRLETDEPVDTDEPDEPLETIETVDTVEPVDTGEIAQDETDALASFEPEPVDGPAFISWRADDEPEPEPVFASPAPGPIADEFVTAGPDWQLGNAMPLVEVRGEGGLVMRRADERWALADVVTTPDFVAEVEVDFRSGPGLGVLFRASTDEDGRMSGYSFDIDPIYDGGGYLVRQWQADRELWNPIARVSGDDPSAMYGTLLVRIEVIGEHLSALVNGVEVLAVENLKQASADRGRDGASGDRIGVQAWSSSDLVIDTARVAAR